MGTKLRGTVLDVAWNFEPFPFPLIKETSKENKKTKDDDIIAGIHPSNNCQGNLLNRINSVTDGIAFI